MLRSMATAPRDGTPFLVVWDDYAVGVLAVFWGEMEGSGREGWFEAGTGEEIHEDHPPPSTWLGWVELTPDVIALMERAREERAAYHLRVQARQDTGAA